MQQLLHHGLQLPVQAWGGADVDLVVCNPPFFHNHPKSPERKRNLARHDDTLPLHVLFAQARRVTHEAGVFQFVFPTDRAQEVRTTASKEGWLFSQRISLAWSASHEPIRDLWTWVKHAGHEHSPTEDVLRAALLVEHKNQGCCVCPSLLANPNTDEESVIRLKLDATVFLGRLKHPRGGHLLH